MDWTWMLGLGVAAALIGAPVAAPATEPIESLARTGTWDVRSDGDSCTLVGRFGTGDASVTAGFTRFEPGDAFDLTLYGKRFAESAHPEVSIDFGTAVRKYSGFGNTSDKMPFIRFSSIRLDGRPNLPSDTGRTTITPDQEAAITGATFAIRWHSPFRLEFGSLAGPFAALRGCEKDLLKRWGFDPGVQTHLSRVAAPAGRPQDWIRPDEFPSIAIRAHMGGLVQFRLDVDEKGAVGECHILYQNSIDAFATTTCATIGKRARFDPALDANGVPIRSFYIATVIFNEPDY